MSQQRYRSTYNAHNEADVGMFNDYLDAQRHSPTAFSASFGGTQGLGSVSLFSTAGNMTADHGQTAYGGSPPPYWLNDHENAYGQGSQYMSPWNHDQVTGGRYAHQPLSYPSYGCAPPSTAVSSASDPPTGMPGYITSEPPLSHAYATIALDEACSREPSIASSTSTSSSLSRSPNQLASNELQSYPPIFLCRVPRCGEAVKVTLDDLTQHLKDKHGIHVQKKKSVSCPWAGCVCSGKAYRPGRCPEGQHPAHVENLPEHIWERHLNFRFVCPQCDRADWADQSSLDRHLPKCPGRMSVRCGRCCSAFATELDLILHVRVCRNAP